MTLGSESFRDCTNNQSISAPLVTAIPNYTFYNNNKLTTVNLPEVLTIGSNAFDCCKSLPTLSLPKVQSIDNYAFGTNSSLTEVSLPSCTTLATEVFGTCASLTKAYLPEVTTMGNRMFIYDTSLQTLGEEGIYLPKMTTIPPETFRECTNMVSAPLHSGITSIGNNAFYKNTNLQSVTIPATVTSIGREAFRYCSSLNNVTLPGSLRLIEDWSFANCTSMENLTIEEGIPSINRDVFQYSGMKNVVLPSTIEAIGMNLFYQCNSLETLDLSKCMNVWELFNYTSLRGSNTIFYGVPSTTKIILPPYTTATLGTNDEIATITFDLQQDSEGFYLINNTSDWDKFVVYSRQNPTINGRITADLDLTTHPGKLGVGNGESNYITYQGTLDGQGHTLTINYKTGKDVSGGLFAYVENATIKNLKVEGNVTANHRLIGGFVGLVKGTLTMQDCESAADITVTPTTTAMHIAGFIGQGKTSTITLTDCLYTGSVTGNTNFRYAAPFLGWMESAGRITYNYCLNIGTFTNTDQNYTYALGVTQYSGQSTAASCFYKPGNNTNNESLATAVSVEQLSSGMVTYRLQGGRADQHWGQLLGRHAHPNLTHEEGTLVYHQPGIYSNNEEDEGLKTDGEGYYLIGSVDEWKMLSILIDDGEYDAKARMTADIDLGNDQTMIGSGINQDNYGTDCVLFQGIFDGQGHTLTVHYNTTELYVAPFRYIQNATITNLRVDGTITTTNRYAGGIVSGCFGNGIHSYITNCISSVDITSNYVNTSGFYEGARTGGIVAQLFFYGQLHITDCIFDGSISGETRDVLWGGFLGLPDGTVTIENGLQIGTFDCSNVISGSNGSGTFSSVFSNGFASRVNVSNNCYYLNQLGNAQGTLVNATTLSDGTITTALQAGRTEEIWVQDDSTGQPILAVFKKNNGIATGLRVITDDDNDTWFTLEGMKLDTKPMQPGVYIKNRRRIIIK
jgi:hypothetical protein